MSVKKCCLFVGTGSMGNTWLHRFLPNFTDRIEISGVVDVDRARVDQAGDFLGLDPSRRFLSASDGFAATDPDFCVVVVPPAFHQDVVVAACERRVPILCEKPIADSWEASLAIHHGIKSADVKMQVIQNYRYTAPMLTFRQVLRSGDLGRINYVVGRFAADYREPLSWGAAFRHEMRHALLIEGSVHHFDQLRNLTGGDCATLAGWEWNPPWSTSKGEFCAMYQMTMTNGVRASYEGNGTAAAEQNSWYQEYYRAECEGGSVAIGRDQIVRIHRFKRGSGLVTQEVPTVRPEWEGHNHQIDEFLKWLDGGPTPETVLDDNLKSNAMLFGAIEASRTGQPVDVEAMLAEGLSN
jgi:predicted dehydrogenase